MGAVLLLNDTGFEVLSSFRTPMWPLKHFVFRKVSPFLIVSSLFGLECLILPTAAVSKQTIVCPAGDFYSMSLILSDVVPDDLGPSWASADLVADIDPVPPYYG